jgi:hypothetical protein
LQAETPLGYSGNALVGLDNITLGWMGSGGPSLDETVVTGVATKDFYTCQLALTPRFVNISGSNDQYSCPLTSLFKDQKFPSVTWCCTAGAPYRQNKADGSLTIGGYDKARSDQSRNLIFNMGVDTTRDLLVAVSNISSDGRPLIIPSFYAFVDSTVPHIWLPLDACTEFEEVVGLVYDNAMDLYLVSDTLHKQMLIQCEYYPLTCSKPFDHCQG